MSNKDLFEKLENWTRSGKKGLAVEALKQIDRSQLDIEELVVLAKFTNRNHVYSLTLQYLYKEKQKAFEMKIQLPQDFITTYAAALLGVGATEEARSLLKTQQNSPPALLSYALSFFSTWDYEKSIPILKKYLKIQTDEYMLLVGRINLVAAYIGKGDYEIGQNLLLNLQKDIIKNPKASVLYGNTFEIQSQIDIENKDYIKAQNSLDNAKEIFKDQLTRYSLYVNKWQAVAQLALQPDSLLFQNQLLDVKKQALTLRNWETLRDCDFQLARFTENDVLLQRNLVGTPFVGYHRRIKHLYGLEVNTAKPFFYNPESDQNLISTADLDLTSPPQELMSSKNCLNLLNLLTRDFYRPARIGVLHAALFPAEYFNPFTSPQRIRNTILRLNQINRELQTGLSVEVKHGDVFLRIERQVAIKLFFKASLFDKENEFLKFIKRYFKGKYFTARDVCAALKISLRQAQNILKTGIEKKTIERIAKGRSTIYRISNNRHLE